MWALTPTTITEGAAAGLWAGALVYFVRRYLLHRKLVSLGIALMTVGWILVAIFDPLMFKIAAVICGVLIWYTIIRVERTGH